MLIMVSGDAQASASFLLCEDLRSQVEIYHVQVALRNDTLVRDSCKFERFVRCCSPFMSSSVILVHQPRLRCSS